MARQVCHSSACRWRIVLVRVQYICYANYCCLKLTADEQYRREKEKTRRMIAPWQLGGSPPAVAAALSQIREIVHRIAESLEETRQLQQTDKQPQYYSRYSYGTEY